MGVFPEFVGTVDGIAYRVGLGCLAALIAWAAYRWSTRDHGDRSSEAPASATSRREFVAALARAWLFVGLVVWLAAGIVRQFQGTSEYPFTVEPPEGARLILQVIEVVGFRVWISCAVALFVLAITPPIGGDDAEAAEGIPGS